MQQFDLPDIKNFVPRRAKPIVMLVFMAVFQLSGGIYLASVSEMAGSLALMHEDIMMAGYASLIGMALTFTIMFRLKFRITTKTALLASAGGLVVCNLVCLGTGSVPLLVGTCFVAGVLRMWGTFACNSAIMMWVTPRRDMSVWFCYICLVVQGLMQMSAVAVVYVDFFSQWRYFHWVVIALLLSMMLVVIVAFRRHRAMPVMPLYGIDWMGCLLWAATLLCVVFMLNYGDFYDWFDAPAMRVAAVFGVVALGLNIWRASFVRHPYIANRTWRARNVWLTFVTYFIVDMLLAPNHVFEPVYMRSILGFDSLNVISLNFPVLAGIVCGVALCYVTFARRKWTYKTMTIIGCCFVVGYLVSMYFGIDYGRPKESLYVPMFLRGMGYQVVAIVFLTALSNAKLPFPNFAQSLSIQSFASACCARLPAKRCWASSTNTP